MSPLAAFLLVACLLCATNAFVTFSSRALISPMVQQSTQRRQQQQQQQQQQKHITRRSAPSMSLLDDAFRFFTNMKKEASAKHILMKGPGATAKLELLKAELLKAPDVSAAFSELAQKVSECPSATRGGNLGTFKPGMMVKEFDKVCFEEEVGKVHGPVETQFGAHLILITRRFEGEK